MATQSLYRRYRPRRFSEVKGQDHVVQALRTAVIEGREGQAYLFSGPRGTGKTTSARILAKVLNCTNAQEGEPCCECESCLAVERGTSYDVHELDAASNNGVDSMRDLIEKASLGTPGRHKVYILDEVHMLTKGAEAALLKTLEEPPPHVVFVLATTDPQKMSDTIRSRTQHLQFHLFSADALQEHVQWVAQDAGLDVSSEAIQQVVVQGAGSARDALSALELVANTGGQGAESVPVGELVEAMAERDPGRALTMVAGAITLGRDPRTLTEELIGYLRNGFLSMMAPDLVQLPSQSVEDLSEQAQRLGAAGLVRGIEQLGEALTEMRHAPDPRVLLDVAIVRLTSDKASTDVASLAARVAKLEKLIANGSIAKPSASNAPASGQPASGEASSGQVPSGEASSGSAQAEGSGSAPPPPGRASLGGRARGTTSAGSPTTSAPDETPRPEATAPEATAPEASAPEASASQPSRLQPSRLQPAAPETAPPEPDAAGSVMSRAVWEDTVRPGLRGMARAVYAPAEFQSNTTASLTLSLPNPVHRAKCEQHRDVVEKALNEAVGAAVTLTLVLAGEPDDGDGDGGGTSGGDGDGSDQNSANAGDSAGGAAAGGASADGAGAGGTDVGGTDASTAAGTDNEAGASGRSGGGSAAGDIAPDEASGSAAGSPFGDESVGVADVAQETPRQAAERKSAEASNGLQPATADESSEGADAEIHVLPQDHEVDLGDLVDAPPESVKTPIDRLAEAFPGSELVEDTY